MTEYIGNVPVSSIQNVEITKGKEQDELYLVDEDSNVIVNGTEQAEQVQIDFTLLEDQHPENLDVDKQRQEVQSLVSNDVVDTSFDYNGREYFLSVGEVSIPETSDLKIIRQGTITATALPWPKNYSGEFPGNNLRVGGDIFFAMDLSADPRVVSIFPEGEVDYEFNVESFTNLLVSSISEIDYSLDVEAESNRQVSSESSVDYTLQFEDTIADMLESSVGVVQFSLDYDGDISVENSIYGTHEFNLNFETELEQEAGGRFGRTFGRSFGGILESWEYSYGNYGGGDYGGTYEEGDYGQDVYNDGNYGE